jgi:hypothetical protein
MALIRPDATQVVTYDASMTPSSKRVLGQLGHVTGAHYSYTMPGGCTQLTCLFQQPPTFRGDAISAGRIVKAWRGATCVFDGKLDEPVPGTNGIALSAHGAGTFGTDFAAVYSGTWPGTVPDDPVNQAIARTNGLRWVNPGIGTPSGMWLGQPVDSGAQSITTLLNTICSNGGLTWYVDSFSGSNILKVFALPTVVNRILISSSPVPRTLGGDINTIFLKYMATADNATTGAVATYGLATATNAASIALHGAMETYQDLSSAGVMTNGAAVAVGNAVLAQYVRASFSGPFTVQPGQVLTTGGQPVDLGCEQAGNVYRLILTDYGYGGEVAPGPLIVIGGGWEYDDDTQTGIMTPFMSLRTSFSGLLAQAAAGLAPATAA